MKTSDITDAQVCRAYAEWQDSRDLFADQVLMLMTNAPEKVALRATERAARRGLVEYGVSLRTGWLTDKGRELLK